MFFYFDCFERNNSENFNWDIRHLRFVGRPKLEKNTKEEKASGEAAELKKRTNISFRLQFMGARQNRRLQLWGKTAVFQNESQQPIL